MKLSFAAKPEHSGLSRHENDNLEGAMPAPPSTMPFPAEHGDRMMKNRTSSARVYRGLPAAVGFAVVILLSAPLPLEAQVVQGVQQGAQAGNRAAGPVGGVLGGAIGGVVGVFTGVLGVPGNNPQAPAQPEAKQAGPAKGTKTAKGKAGQPATPQVAEPQLTAEQIVANSD